MKMIKKWISIIVVLAMLVTLPVTSFAGTDESKEVPNQSNVKFTDVDGTEYYAEAAITLEKIGVLMGYKDGTFGAEKSITRAEMAAIVCRTIDKEKDADAAKSETKFDDVSKTHWASGYINIASKEGIIKGDGNGKFRPEDNVRYEEAIKMVVCAAGLGGGVKENPKDWSAGYIEVAKTNGITNNLKGSKGVASTRGDVAAMVYGGMKVAVPVPTASVPAGKYTETKNVTLSSTIKDAAIYYTLDGTEPTVKSTKYSKAISLSKTTTLKAIAVTQEGLPSRTMVAEYIIETASYGGGGGGGGSAGTTSYKVSFDLNYEGAVNIPEAQNVKSGEYAKVPDMPVREGYAFAGWYKEFSCVNEFNFAIEKISSNNSLYAKWINVSDGKVLSVKADITDIEINTNKDVKFEAEVFGVDENLSVVLVDEDNNIIGEMADDGMKEDDIANDNVFSAVFSLGKKNPGKIAYYVKIEDQNKSDASVYISYYKKLTEEDYNALKEVDDTIILMQESFAETGDEEKDLALAEEIYNKTIKYLDEQVAAGEILEYSKENENIQLTMKSGVTHVVSFDLYDEFESVSRGSNIQNCDYSFSDNESIILMNAKNNIITLEPYASELGNAAFDEAANSIANSKFEYSFDKNLDNAEVSLEVLKKLNDYKVVIINGHGGYTSTLHSFFGTGVKETALNNELYSADLGSGRLISLQKGQYGVTVDFFDYYYDENSFDDTIVYLGTCHGADDNVLADTLLTKGVSTCMAYKKSVTSAYDAKMVKTIFEEMSKGEKGSAVSAITALNKAKTLNGEKDSTNAHWSIFNWLFGYYQKESERAELVLMGKPDFTLDNKGNTNLSNVSFENGLSNWTTSGDCRTISALGTLVPPEGSYMALVGTGLGAVSESNSILYRTFIVPKSAKYLTLDYNFVSEEPLEYYESEFDDTLTFSVVCNGEATEVKKITVNTSEWKYLGENYFQGGDSTTYHTGWGELSIDLSKYNCDDAFTLLVNIFDLGDSEFDSAVLIDNLRFLY